VHFEHSAAWFDRSRLAVIGRFGLPVVAVGVLGNSWATALRAICSTAVWSGATARATAAATAAFFPLSHVILH
jgi:hypothetical protein